MYKILTVLALLPTFIHAQNPRDFGDVVDIVTGLIDLLVVAIFSLTLVVLIWAIINAWIIKGGDAVAIEQGKKTVVIGIVVLVIMSGIWGILALLRSSLFGL